MQPVRISAQTLALLELLLEHPTEWRYGYELSRQTGLKSGTLYPLLMRLADKLLLETRWEDAVAPGRPPRHMYRLSAAGQRWAREQQRSRSCARTLKPAFGDRS